MAVTIGERGQGSWRSQTNHRSFDDGSRTLLFSSPKVSSREEGSREARRIVDPSTMGSSLPYRLLTFGEEAEGAGLSPGVKKPKV